ncbi:MAG TPA: flagellar M-ring protein FliF C-terminal domain-containing protein [Tepidisphaeraceae bacterium]|jgi:flagellar biosynthesis/type III secretory pathway M-ring protein FliF/YscJ
MDLLKAQLERIQKQLTGLNASQKMLVASLAAIMVITVVWWGKYAGEAEMVPLLNQSFSANDLGPIQDRLTTKGISFTVSGDKLLVPADRRMEILSDLTYARVMPHNTQAGFDEIVKEMSPFDSQEKQQKIWNHGKEAALSQVISDWPGVAQADVIIDATNQQRVEGSTQPSATVNITMREGAKAPQGLADTAADAVSGAVAGLDSSRIKVVINGYAHRVHGGQDALGNGAEQLELVQQNEARAEDKVRNSFGDTPNILVAVTCKLNTSTVRSEKHEVDPKKTITKVTQSDSETDQTNGPAAGGEAGTVSNTALSVNGGGSSGGVSQVHEKTEEKSQVIVSDEHTISSTPAGDAPPVSATVRFPLSHFVKLFQWQAGSTQTPTSAQLQPIVNSELEKYRQMVANCLGLSATDKISVYAYVDTFPSLSAPPVASASTVGLSLMVGRHAKEIALGTLAMMSLFMASMMVRKAAPAPLPAAAATGAMSEKAGAAGNASMSIGGEMVAGEAVEGEGHLEGMELSDDSIKAGRMVDQVSTLVREDPDTAAALVRRWMGRP